MGIENFIKKLVPNTTEEQARMQANAMLSGKINEVEGEKTGIPKDKVSVFNTDFNEKGYAEFEYDKKGDVTEFGSIVVYNKGDDPNDPNYQLTQTAKRTYIRVPDSRYYAVHEYNENTRKVSVKFYSPMGQEIKDDVDGNNKVTKTAEQKFAELTNLDPNGKYGVKDGFLVAIKDEEESSGMSTGATILATTGAGALAGGIGGATFMGIGAVPGAVIGGIGGLVTGIMSSCTDINQNVGLKLYVELNQNSELKDILAAIRDLAGKINDHDYSGQLAEINKRLAELYTLVGIIVNNLDKLNLTADQILVLCGDNKDMMEKILDAITKNNSLLKDLRNLMIRNNEQNDEILKVLLQLQTALQKLGEDQAANFTKVINAINNLGNKLPNLEPLLKEILEAINNNTANDDKNAQLILDAIANLKLNGGNVDLSTITQLLQDIKGMFANVPNYMAKFDAILAKLDSYGGDIVKLLNDILEAIKNHTCNCNCGGGSGSHEGILDDITGLIS